MTKLTDYVMTAEAAEILGVAQNTLRKWAARGEIPMHRNPANGYRLFRREDLDEFLRKTAQPPACGFQGSKPSIANWAWLAYSTCRPRHSSSGAPVTPRERCSPGR